MRVLATSMALNVLDPHSLLASLGTIGVFVVLFAETGLLVGFFLPGDSLLFTAGLLCATGAGSAIHLSLPWVCVAGVAGALLGAQTGYVIGRVAGPPLLERPNRPRLSAGIAAARRSLGRYGPGKAIVLARFIPVVRTALNPLAGILGVRVRRFVVWQVIGGVSWVVVVTLAGYVLGSHIPSIDRYLLPIIALVIVVSLIPIGLELLRSRRRRRQCEPEREAP
jgi:membrane-associated protein